MNDDYENIFNTNYDQQFFIKGNILDFGSEMFNTNINFKKEIDYEINLNEFIPEKFNKKSELQTFKNSFSPIDGVNGMSFYKI